MLGGVTDSGYIYDPAWESERARLAGLEEALDPVTTACLSRAGVGPGWRCLEVGGGGGSITAWLCERAGEVVATDLDTRFLDTLEYDNLTVIRHDVVREPMPGGGFDLVHTRDVLEHIPERIEVLDKLIGALNPGGWLVVEDVDFGLGLATGFEVTPPLDELMPKVMRASARWMATKGVDAMFGRRLPSLFRERGLRSVSAVMHARVLVGSENSSIMRLSLEHLGPRLVEAGELSGADIDALLEAVADPGLLALGPMHVSAWGRAPA